MKYLEVTFHLKDYTPFSMMRVTPADKIPEKNAECLIQQIFEKCEGKLEINTASSAQYSFNSDSEKYKLYKGNCPIVAGSFSTEVLTDENFEIVPENMAVYRIFAHVEITSRFDKDALRPYFLTAMILGLTDDDKRKPIENTEFSANDTSLLDYMLVHLFRKRFAEAVQNGFYRTYITREGNDSRLKGHIDIARHIRMNAGLNNGKIAYAYREYTTENYLNQLIIYAYEHLMNTQKKRMHELFPPDSDEYLKICQLKHESPMTASRKTVLMKNLRPIAHPYFSNYEKLRQLCVLILREEGLNLSSGMNIENISLLFRISDLWEEYLKALMEKYIETDSLKVKTQSQLPGGLRPDFILCRDGQPIMILDAKYKPHWLERLRKADKDIQADVLQCENYRRLSKTRIFGILYPADKEEKERIYHHQNSCRFNYVSEYAFPLFLPETNGQSYDEWKTELDKNAETMMTEIINSVNTFDEGNKL